MDKNELRRLEKAARDKNKQKLADWGEQFEQYIKELLRVQYDKMYEEELANTLDNYQTALTYTLHYCEDTKLNKEQLDSFMEDLLATIDMYRSGEAKPSDFKNELEDLGINVPVYDYNKIYRKYLDMLDNDLVKYLRSTHRRKIVAVIADIKNTDLALSVGNRLTLNGDIVIYLNVLEHESIKGKQLVPTMELEVDDLDDDKLTICDELFVINPDNKPNAKIDMKIKYAEEHNKKITYYNADTNENMLNQ